MADLVEGASAQGKEVAAIFLDCSKCYERVPLAPLKSVLLEAGLPPALVGPAVAMYKGDWRLLVHRTVSDPVRPHNGIPAGCGLAVDILHAYLARALGESGAHLVSYRKYVDDMVLVAVGRRVGPDLRESFLQVREALARAGMVLNPKKTVVVCNGPVARASVTAAWRNRSLPQLVFTTRDLGVDVQWGPWSNPVEQGRWGTFQKTMLKLRSLGLAVPSS